MVSKVVNGEKKMPVRRVRKNTRYARKVTRLIILRANWHCSIVLFLQAGVFISSRYSVLFPKFQLQARFCCVLRKWNSGEHYAIKFWVKLKNSTRMFWNRSIGNISYQQHKFFVGTEYFWKTKNQLTIYLAQGDLQQQKRILCIKHFIPSKLAS